jgi:PAS domain S-box-containing protein
MDINMPGKSGIELLSEVIAGYPDVAVIMISAVANSDTAIACMRQGAYDYIIKPFNSHEVVTRIENALEKRKLKIDNWAYQLHLEQKVEEQIGKLRASEVNFRNSLENSPIGIRIVNSEGKTIYANRAFLDIFGYSNATELDSVPYDKLYTPETYAAHEERVRKGRFGETAPLKYENDIVRKNGEIRRLLVNRGEVFWNGEKRFQMLYQDVTERVQAEKALQASYDKLDKTLDAVIQTIALTVEMRDPYTAGHQHRVARLACAIAEEMGLPQEKINGMRVVGAIHDIGKIRAPAEILSKPG